MLKMVQFGETELKRPTYVVFTCDECCFLSYVFLIYNVPTFPRIDLIMVIIIRPHRSTTQMRHIVSDRVAWSVNLSVCLSQ